MSASPSESAPANVSLPVSAGRHPQMPFAELLQMRLATRGEGSATIELDVAPHHLRSLGIAHGGVLASLLDTAMGTAVMTRERPGYFVVTVQLGVNYIRPAWDGEQLVAVAQVQHSGKQTAVARSEIRTAAGVLVATGTGTFMYVAHPDRLDLPRQDDATVANSPLAPA